MGDAWRPTKNPHPAVINVAKQISVSYSTAWMMLHKLRRALRRRDERYVLQGLVEVNETYVGGKAEGPRGRGAYKKAPMAVALELRSDGKPERSTWACTRSNALTSIVCVGLRSGRSRRTRH